MCAARLLDTHLIEDFLTRTQRIVWESWTQALQRHDDNCQVGAPFIVQNQSACMRMVVPAALRFIPHSHSLPMRALQQRPIHSYRDG